MDAFATALVFFHTEPEQIGRAGDVPADVELRGAALLALSR
jgi:hypothetical protein